MKWDAAMDLGTIFYYNDKFCNYFEKEVDKRFLLKESYNKVPLYEVITIMIAYYYSGYQMFKDYYLKSEVLLKSAFPLLFSSTSFIELKAETMIPMALFLRSCGLLACTSVSFIY